MDDKGPAKPRFSRFQKSQPGAAPKPAPEPAEPKMDAGAPPPEEAAPVSSPPPAEAAPAARKSFPPRGASGPAAGARKPGAPRSAPPPEQGSKLKAGLMLFIVIGLVGIVTASFFKKAKGSDRSIAMVLISRGLQAAGLQKLPEPPAKKELEKHPRFVEYLAIGDDLKKLKNEITKLETKVIERAGEKDKPIEKDEADAFRGQIEEVLKKVSAVGERLGPVMEWTKVNDDKREELRKLHHRFKDDDKKLDAMNKTVMYGETPKELEAAAQDPDVKRSIELCKEMEIGKYDSAAIDKLKVSQLADEIPSLMIQIKGMRGRLPRKEGDPAAAVAANPDPPRPVTPGPASQPGKSVVELNAKFFHPWGGALPGTWARFRITAGQAVSFEDKVVKKLTDDAVTLGGRRAEGGAAKDVEDAAQKFAEGGGAKGFSDEPVKVGDKDIPCRVVQIGGTKFWFLKEGPGAGRVWLKSVAGEVETVATAMGAEPVQVKDKALNCTWIQTAAGKTWYADEAPGILVKSESAGSLVELIDFGPDAASIPAEFPKAEAPPPPAPALVTPKWPDRYASFKPGAWRREKNSSKVGDKTTVGGFGDTTVLAVTDAAVTVKMDAHADGKVESKELPMEVGVRGKAVREEKLKVGDQEIACIVVETKEGQGMRREWLAKEGPTVGFVPLKTQGGSSSSAVTEIGEDTLKIGDRELKCLRVKVQAKAEDSMIQTEEWYSAEVLGFNARMVLVEGEGAEARTSITEVVAFGADPAKKPALEAKAPAAVKPPDPTPAPSPTPAPKPAPNPTPKPDPTPVPPKPAVVEKTVKEFLAEADEDVKQAAKHYQEVTVGLDPIPTDPERLKTLQLKADLAASEFTRAKETYLKYRDQAPDPAAIDKRLGQIGNLTERLKKHQDTIKSNLK